MQAMECNDEDENGNPSELTYKRYENLAKGEAGMVSLEAISITEKAVHVINNLLLCLKMKKL